MTHRRALLCGALASLVLAGGAYVGAFALLRWWRPDAFVFNGGTIASYDAFFAPLRHCCAEETPLVARARSGDGRVIAVYAGCNAYGDKVFVELDGTTYALYTDARAGSQVARRFLQLDEHVRIELELAVRPMTDWQHRDYYLGSIVDFRVVDGAGDPSVRAVDSAGDPPADGGT